MKFCRNKRFLKGKKQLQTHQIARKKRLQRLKARKAELSSRRAAWFVAQEV